MQWLQRGQSNHGNCVHELKSLIDYWLGRITLDLLLSESSALWGFCFLDVCKSKGFCGECQRNNPGLYSMNCFLASRFINEQFLASASRIWRIELLFLISQVEDRPLQSRSQNEGHPQENLLSLLEDMRNKEQEKKQDPAAGAAVNRTAPGVGSHM